MNQYAECAGQMSAPRYTGDVPAAGGRLAEISVALNELTMKLVAADERLGQLVNHLLGPQPTAVSEPKNVAKPAGAIDSINSLVKASSERLQRIHDHLSRLESL